MMKTNAVAIPWLFSIIFIFSVVILNAQDTPTAAPEIRTPAGPLAKIEFENTVYDFGVVEEGAKVSRVFTFTNTSNEPLFLSDAKGSCGCTVPQWPREPIMPGETASITVEFNSKNKRGKRNQRVTITANTEPAQTFIFLKGEIISDDEISISSPEMPEKETEMEIGPDCFAIYPNPTAEMLHLEMEAGTLGQPATVSIYAKNGQLMAKRLIESVDGPIEFNVAHYPAGTYIANVQIGNRKPEARCFVVN